MAEDEKNLEARDRVLHGVIRAPLSIIVGGPLGFAANVVYTAAAAKHEVDRENKHKAYLETLKPHYPTPEEVEQHQQERTDLEDYINKEFENAKKYGCWKKKGLPQWSMSSDPSSKYCKLTDRLADPCPYTLWIKENGEIIEKGDAISYRLEDFVEIYEKDKDDQSIRKYVLGGDWCYKVNAKPYYVVGRMFGPSSSRM